MSAWYEDIITDTVEDTNTIYTFADDVSTTGFSADEVTVFNYGSNEIFVNFRGPVATTSHRRIAAGSTVTFVDPSPTNDGISSIGVICSSGETSTIQIWSIKANLNPSNIMP